MKETQSFEGEQGGIVSRHLALGTMGIYIRRSAIRRIFVLLITFSSNDLSSRLLKIEQKSTIAFFPQISTKWFPLSSVATKNFKFRVWFVKKKASFRIGYDSFLSTSIDCLQRTVMIKSYQINWFKCEI